MPVKFQRGVSLAVAGAIPLYVVGYYPAEKHGAHLPPHEHIETSTASNSSLPAIFTSAEIGATRTRVAQQLVIRY